MKSCPSCKRLFDPADNHVRLPFCSERCKLIDLGKWLNEDHRIPEEEHDSGDANGQTPVRH